MRTEGLPTIAAVGALTGLRSGLGPALVAQAFTHRHGRKGSLGARLLSARRAAQLTRAFAITELVMDQNPKAPNRTAPSALAPRLLAGVLIGTALSKRRRGSVLVPALVGGVSALLATYASLPLRLALAKKVKPVAAGLIEDALVIGAGAALLPALA